MTRTSTQNRLDQALTRLLAGQPTITDGAINVSNLCREAGVGRDSFYRSPQEFKDRFTSAQANHSDNQPEIVRLRDELRKLKREHADERRKQAEAIRDLEETNKTYANHIQALTLANAELADENQLLRSQINPHEGNVTRLPRR
ncbi:MULTISPECIES: hypothetical protein [unclassified Streptomyces]|uniref:hypothetical protein n=1 Tax=unclassified Streptomyces TaxID=2593676 RepID=UPI0003817AA4|nr:MULTISPECIES: hypothetical protein [unclassified Streptomyces]MCR8574285.1 hypothetical protein [Streptomyces sp. Isolate_219]